MNEDTAALAAVFMVILATFVGIYTENKKFEATQNQNFPGTPIYRARVGVS